MDDRYINSLILSKNIISITGFIVFVLGITSIGLAIFEAIANNVYLYLWYPIYMFIVILISGIVTNLLFLRRIREGQTAPEITHAIAGIIAILATMGWLGFYVLF